MNNSSSASLITATRTYRPDVMARVLVWMYATVREASGVASCEVDASDLQELMQNLKQRYGGELARILDTWTSEGDGIVVLVNGRNTNPGGFRNLRFNDGDEISIFPPVSGG